MRDSEQTYKVEDWNDYEICVRGDGTFFVKDDYNKIRFEGRSIDAIKRELSKSTPIDLWAFMEGWRYNQEDQDLERVHVYARTGLGNLMYTRGTMKRRLRRGEKLLVIDTDRAKERLRLLRMQREASVGLRKLMTDWPTVKGADA